MAVQLEANLLVKLVATLSDPLDLSTPKDEVWKSISLLFTNGIGDDQGNEMFHDERTLAASATEDLDLSGTALQNVFGDNIALTEMKVLIVEALSTNTNNVEVSRPASNGVPFLAAAGDKVSLGPGDFFVFVRRAGVTVTAGTGDLITFTNSAGSTEVKYRVIILGNRSS